MIGYGFSLGGMIITALAIKHAKSEDRLFDALILNAPNLKLKIDHNG